MDNKIPGKDVTASDLADKFPLAHSRLNRDGATSFHCGTFEFSRNSFAVMAGPNMVESEELIVDVAKRVKALGAQFLRGGAFKPLTFPYRSKNYMETRHEGLSWLKTAKTETGINIITVTPILLFIHFEFK